MKATIATIMLILATSCASSVAGEPEFRLSAGVSISNVDYQAPPLWFKSNVSGTTEASGSMRVVSRTDGPFSFETGLDFTRRGGSLELYSTNPSDGRVELEWRLETYTVPVLIRFQQRESDPFVKLGFGVDIVGDGRRVRGDGGSGFDRDPMKSFDVLAMLGGGLDWNLDRLQGFVEVEAAIGLINVESEASRSSLRNRTMRIGAGVILGGAGE